MPQIQWNVHRALRWKKRDCCQLHHFSTETIASLLYVMGYSTSNTELCPVGSTEPLCKSCDKAIRHPLPALPIRHPLHPWPERGRTMQYKTWTEGGSVQGMMLAFMFQKAKMNSCLRMQNSFIIEMEVQRMCYARTVCPPKCLCSRCYPKR